MHRKIYVALALLSLALPFAASAHDPSKHKGKATEGDIVAVAGDRIELKTAKGPLTVTFADALKVERGNHAIDKSQLKKGEHVAVFGTKLPTGELIAREIVAAPSAKTGAGNKGGLHPH
jgi:hypothetical protein